MKTNYKNRVALRFMLFTAAIKAISFVAIYLIVKQTVYQNLDSELTLEALKHTEEITILDTEIVFKNKREWEEIEHQEVQIHPVFIQIFDVQGNVLDKSPNLKNLSLNYNPFIEFGGHFNDTFQQISIRQVQMPIEENGKIRGYIAAAISMESANATLYKLLRVLIISFLMVMILLYFTSRYLAEQSILPVKIISKTVKNITRNNLKERVKLPIHKDELFELSTEINELLQRIENALEREKQFTSDASHELRTPLASLNGTLEVLLRKPRTPQQYQEKIEFSIEEINKMSDTLEQLLELARLDSKQTNQENHLVPILVLVDELISKHKQKIKDKELQIETNTFAEEVPQIPKSSGFLILDNLLNNAVKYSKQNGKIIIEIYKTTLNTRITIKDEGIGIAAADLENIFTPFYRSEPLKHPHIKGSGLGLSVSKKAVEALNGTLEIESKPNMGSTVHIIF